MVKTPKAAYTTGEVAALCRVTKRTVIKWVDTGRLKGYLIPGSTHRRIPADALAAFMRKNGMPDFDQALPRRKVLVVDDDRDFADLLREALHDRYQVETVGCALDAASRLTLFRPDIILLDVRLPDLSGLQVCRHFHDYCHQAGARILCMSAYGHEIDPEELRRSGADGFLSKPLKLKELRNRIEAMVG